jgi:hypothetical protein
MRVVTWNCNYGECRRRAARLDCLKPDLKILQECSEPAGGVDDHCLWFGNDPNRGVGVLTTGIWRLAQGLVDLAVPDSTYPVCVSGPVVMHLLAVWAQRRPTYVRAILEGLDRYRPFLLAGPTIVVGDLNSHARWDPDQHPAANHTALVRSLCEEFGLVSAFHAAEHHLGFREEPATLYWQWQRNQPYHIDYCFIPVSWAPGIRAVEVGDFDDWREESDHRPLLVELNLTGL